MPSSTTWRSSSVMSFGGIFRKKTWALGFSYISNPAGMNSASSPLLSMEKQYPAVPIYHYGSYEPRAIATLAKRYETDAESVTKRLVNVNKHIYGKVYFPVWSNRLKDIGHFIGAQWTSPHASGLQSLVWRHHW